MMKLLIWLACLCFVAPAFAQPAPPPTEDERPAEAKKRPVALLMPPGTVIYFPNGAANKLTITHYALQRKDVEAIIAEVTSGRMAKEALSECLVSAQEAVSPDPWWVTPVKIGGLTAALTAALVVGYVAHR